ncbi:hypothetical protein [Streptomyces sp. NPDC090025]|uniref:hypothetical protein n=1 Tax=Streptomyces sp. NPDC090025 TaxID=3365922 RepID=UPI003837CF16
MPVPHLPGPGGVHPGRARASVRELYERPLLDVRDLTAPLLVLPTTPDHGLPGAVALFDVPATVSRWRTLGLRGLKLFAYGEDRSPTAREALSERNLMVRAIRSIRSAVPDMVVTTEVCGCAWTSHGECVIVDRDGSPDLAASYALMARMAVLHAEAGADAVSPTAMLDGSVHAVRSALTDSGHVAVGVCPNIALHTELYGPFKSLMATNPARGHRRSLQLAAHQAPRQALAQARLWETEGADSLCLQPALTAVDVLTALRPATDRPIIAYSTSGEYAVLRALGPRGAAEYLGSLKRAGADLVLTFAAEDVARHLGDERAPLG